MTKQFCHIRKELTFNIAGCHITLNFGLVATPSLNFKFYKSRIHVLSAKNVEKPQKKISRFMAILALIYLIFSMFCQSLEFLIEFLLVDKKLYFT